MVSDMGESVVCELNYRGKITGRFVSYCVWFLIFLSPIGEIAWGDERGQVFEAAEK